MKVGELYVELGLQGAEKAVSGLASIKKGLSSIVTESLFAFAQVSGLVAAFAAMNSASGNAGMSLQKFANLTGISTDALQRWQWVLGQSGVSADETSQAFVKVQSAMSSIKLLNEPPAWLNYIGAQVGIDPRKYEDTLYMMQKLRDFAQNGNDPRNMKAEMLRESGLLSDNMIQALLTNTHQLSETPLSLIRSPQEAAALAKSKVAWDNYYSYLGRIRDSFVEKNSGPILKDLYKLADILRKDILPAIQPAVHSMTQFAETLLDFAEKHPGVTTAFAKIALSVTALTAALGPLVGVLGGLGTIAGGIGTALAGVFGIATSLPVLGGLLGAAGSAAVPRGSALDRGFTDLGVWLQQHAGLMPQTATARDMGAIHVTQNITAPSPEKAAAMSADKIKQVVGHKKDYQHAYRSNPRVNEY